MPLTGQTFAILLVGASLGSIAGTACTLLYVIIDALGSPVYADHAHGWRVLNSGNTQPLSVRKDEKMLYMLVEQFRSGPQLVYDRAGEHGRMLPDGVRYLDSWVGEETLSVCYQLMEADSIELLQAWVERWSDLIDFEIVPVVSSAEARRRVEGSG